MNSDFHDQIIALLPKLRIQALALTRHKAAAEDLVQEAVCNALKAQASFIPGTNFPAWMHRILRNRFISDLRRKRETSDIENVPESAFATSGAHEDRIALKELSAAMDRLPSDQREALMMVVLHGMSYEELAESTGCAVGTAKSRVFRARRQLHRWLVGDEDARPAMKTGVLLYLDDAMDNAAGATRAARPAAARKPSSAITSGARAT